MLNWIGRLCRPEKVLVLRNCRPDMTAFGGFKWPTSGRVKARDWHPAPQCGHGLHGWLWGEGDHGLGYHLEFPDAKWLVVEVNVKDIVDLSDKVKFRKGKVVYCGTSGGASEYIAKRRPNHFMIGRDAHASLDRTVVGGPHSNLTGGYYSRIIAGPKSTLTGQGFSIAVGAERANVKVGDCSIGIAQFNSVLIGGENSVLIGRPDTQFRGGPGAMFIVRDAGGYGDPWLASVTVGEDGFEPDVNYEYNMYLKKWTRTK